MKKYFVYLLIALFLSSCLSEPEEVTVINSDQEFKIDLNQALSPEGPHLVLEISSLDEFNCTNVVIENSLSISDSGLEWIIEKFKIPNDCDNPSEGILIDVAKGQSSVYLDNAIYDLTIGADQLFHNTGEITVDEDEFSINIPSLEGIILGRSSIYKIPTNHVWGTLNVESSSLTFEEFSSGLADYVRKSQNLDSGDYGIFAIDAAEQITFHNYQGNSESEFIFEIEDLDGLINYIGTVRETFDDIELVVTLSDGENL